MATKQPKMIDYLTLEDGEYQATSEDGGIHVSRECALGIVTVQVRADYAALAKLVAAGSNAKRGMVDRNRNEMSDEREQNGKVLRTT